MRYACTEYGSLSVPVQLRPLCAAARCLLQVAGRRFARVAGRGSQVAGWVPYLSTECLLGQNCEKGKGGWAVGACVVDLGSWDER